MNTTYTVTGIYGMKNQNTGKTYVYITQGQRFYALHDSINVNATYDPIGDGTLLEKLKDHDGFENNTPICSEEDLILAVNE